MNEIHTVMAQPTTANSHDAIHNARIESLARRRKISAVTFFSFGIMLVIAGSLLASFEKQRFSVSIIVFGGIAIIFALLYWVSAEKILIALRKVNTNRVRTWRYTQSSSTPNSTSINREDLGQYLGAYHSGLPSYEQSVLQLTEIPPSYEQAINIKSSNDSSQNSSNTPIQSVSFVVDQTNPHLTTVDHTSHRNSNSHPSE